MEKRGGGGVAKDKIGERRRGRTRDRRSIAGQGITQTEGAGGLRIGFLGRGNRRKIFSTRPGTGGRDAWGNIPALGVNHLYRRMRGRREKKRGKNHRQFWGGVWENRTAPLFPKRGAELETSKLEHPQDYRNGKGPFRRGGQKATPSEGSGGGTRKEELAPTRNMGESSGQP